MNICQGPIIWQDHIIEVKSFFSACYVCYYNILEQINEANTIKRFYVSTGMTYIFTAVKAQRLALIKLMFLLQRNYKEDKST